MVGVTKRFPGVVANNNIDFDLLEGEVHGLLGENGAGKTTLMNILSGLYRADEGSFYIYGKPVKIHSPKDALKLGIGMVHQHFSLVPKFTVVDNVALALSESDVKVKKSKEIAEMIVNASKEMGFYVDPWVEVSQLSVGEQQRVEILKVLLRGAKIIILDEPTSVLAPVEISGLFKIIRHLAEQGRSIVFITHKLGEALAICDRITILRSGVKVGVLDRREIRSTSEVVRMMFGAEPEYKLSREHGPTNIEVMRVEGLYVKNDLGIDAVRDVNLTLHSGEILGVAGVEGNGQKELAEALAGLRPIQAGKIWIKGEAIASPSPSKLHDIGVTYITDDRVAEGIVRELDIAENVILKNFRRPPYRKKFLIDWGKVEDEAKRLVKEYGIAARGPRSLAQTLSGGTLQKLLVARELSGNPVVLIANQPTHGLDVMTTRYVHERLIKQASQGTGILLISNDLDEVLTLSDTVAVMYRGEIVGTFPKKEATKERIGPLMVGFKEVAS